MFPSRAVLFYEFYTKINYIEKGLNVTRKTASGYLASLEEAGFLTSQMVGKEKLYLNKALFDVVQDAGSGNKGLSVRNHHKLYKKVVILL